VVGIRITLMQIRIPLFTFIRIRIRLFFLMRIRILLLVKEMRICDHLSTDRQSIHFEPPRLHCRAATAIQGFDAAADPDMAFPLMRIRIRNTKCYGSMQIWIRALRYDVKIFFFISYEIGIRKLRWPTGTLAREVTSLLSIWVTKQDLTRTSTCMNHESP
jgi:hypothetical protein